MDVEQRLLALEWHKTGKGGDKGKDAKGKGKSKHGCGKGKVKGKSKDKTGTKDKDGKKAERFEGYCNGCGKWGHRLLLGRQAQAADST